jgi:hypothetical protein
VTADFPVVLDACVLANQPVTDLLLRLAETPRLYLPYCYWSEQILEETRRTLIEKLHWPLHLVQYREQQMREHFPEAIVRFPKSLLSILTNDEKDRHVLRCCDPGKSRSNRHLQRPPFWVGTSPKLGDFCEYS